MTISPRPGSTRRWRKLRRRVLERDHHRCHWCGRHATHADHVVAWSEGGARYNLDNLVASCAACNLKRGGKLGRTRQLARHGEPPVPSGRRVWAGAIDAG
jgi:5-methylcytosine-specific restriction endonuclease McrA